MFSTGSQMIDECVQQWTAEGMISGGGSPLDVSAVFAGILGRDDPEVARLVAAALPPEMTASDLASSGTFRHGAWSERGSSGPGPEMTPRCMAALADYDAACRSGISRGWVSLMECVLKRFGAAERAEWTPLDVPKLLESCATYTSAPREAAQPEAKVAAPLWHSGIELPLENLTERVRAAGFENGSPYPRDTAYGGFFDELCRALHRSSPRHVLLVRDRGVGERAALIELTRRGLEGRPPFLADKQVLLMDCRQVPAEEVRHVIETVFLKPGLSQSAILCMDGLAALFQATGPWNNRAVLLSALARAECRVIGILSPREFEEHILSDPEISELFSPVVLSEPDVDVATSLVRHFASGMEVQYQVKIDDEATRRAVLLSDSYILHERLPYKAVKLLRAVCDDLEYDRSQAGAARAQVTDADVVRKASQMTGIPEATLAGVGDAVDYHASFSNLIVGQDHVVREVATELGLIKAGMVDPGKPASVMMFVGQTGTGKTEMAKALARFYSSSKRLKTFTLGNFSEPHSVSGIIGVPPGYVGHEQGGRLVNELNSDPYGVFLLDEADKAHPDVMQPFLNLFDEGWVADQKGNKAYANRAIFILTTNVGQRQIADMCKSGKSVEEMTAIMKDSLSRIRHTKSNRPVFTAEFLARVKRIIVFRSLDQPAMQGICRLLIGQLQRDWPLKRQKALVLPDELLEVIARRGFEIDDQSQGREGGRIVRKLIADVIEAPIQAAIGAAPDTYRACGAVVVTFSPTGETDAERLSTANIGVQFQGADS